MTDEFHLKNKNDCKFFKLNMCLFLEFKMMNK